MRAQSDSTNAGKISVILPCYNAEKYIRDAIESILSQSYSNLELVVINDGSTDASLSIIESLADTDPRVMVISRENRGLIASLNEGISIATGSYIARMDADDISLPDRLQLQMRFMFENDLDLVGGAISRFYPSPDKKERPKFYPEKNDALVASILTLKSRIAHPTLLAKKAVFDSCRYDPRFKHAEDYALWLQVVLSGKFRIGNYPGLVLRYRSHPTQVHKLHGSAEKGMKRLIFTTLMLPLVENDSALLEIISDFWQSNSLATKYRGIFALGRWFRYLEKQHFFNKQIKRNLVVKAIRRLF